MISNICDIIVVYIGLLAGSFTLGYVAYLLSEIMGLGISAQGSFLLGMILSFAIAIQFRGTM